MGYTLSINITNLIAGHKSPGPSSPNRGDSWLNQSDGNSGYAKIQNVKTL